MIRNHRRRSRLPVPPVSGKPSPAHSMWTVSELDCKKDTKSGKRRNLGTFNSKTEAEKHERAVQFFKRKG